MQVQRHGQEESSLHEFVTTTVSDMYDGVDAIIESAKECVKVIEYNEAEQIVNYIDSYVKYMHKVIDAIVNSYTGLFTTQSGNKSAKKSEDESDESEEDTEDSETYDSQEDAENNNEEEGDESEEEDESGNLDQYREPTDEEVEKFQQIFTNCLEYARSATGKVTDKLNKYKHLLENKESAGG